jgi:hypothetical protein
VGFRNPILGGGGALVRPAIKSPNYVPGVSGWQVKRTGDAEFNDLNIRGTFNGTDYVVSADGIFFYSSTPAAGNMVGSWAPADGTDPYGNAYTAGLNLYSALGNVFLGGLDGIIQSLGSSGALINIEDGQYSFSNPGDWNTGLMIQNLVRTHGSYYIGGGSQSFNDLNTLFGIITSYGNPVAGSQDTFPRTSTAAYSGSAVAHHYVSGAVVKCDLGGNTGEVWHNVAMGTGWATGPGISGSYPPLKQRLDAMDNVHLWGTFHATSTTPNTILGTGLPTTNQTALGGVGVAGAAVKISTSPTLIPLYLNNVGELRSASLPTIAVNDTFMISAVIPRAVLLS